VAKTFLREEQILWNFGDVVLPPVFEFSGKVGAP
jgi:hypothetical protein